MYLQFTEFLDLNCEFINYNMIFIPATSKYKKQQKGKAFNRIKSNLDLYQLKFGTVGLKTTSFGRLDSKQLNSFKKSVVKIIKKRGKFILNVFPQTPITKKPLAIRMGKGKGFVDH
jgi:large subunit ribosomal protein L16